MQIASRTPLTRPTPAFVRTVAAHSSAKSADVPTGFESPGEAAVIVGGTVVGAVLGSLALGWGTVGAQGATETLLGLVQGGVAGAGLGIAGGAVLSTAMLSQPGTQGRIGLALVGGALGGLAGLATGAVAGAYLGHAAGNLVGYAGGAVAGGAVGYFVARHFVE